MNSLPDLESARLALLGESCEIANAVGLEYAVCGGWSPYLRNSSPVRHPGTKDVDLLFSDGVKVDGLHEVFQAFRDRDFLPSSKHEFQLIRIYDVGQTRLAFNVDLLHPTEGKVHGDMFVDHCELPVLEDCKAITSLFMEKSIAAPYSTFVFAGFKDSHSVNCPRLDGTFSRIRIPLIDEVGILVTKSESCRSPKRPRDLLDIYLAISQPSNRELFLERLSRLKKFHPAAFNLMREIPLAFNTRHGTPEPIRRVFESAGLDPSRVIQHINQFLDEWGLLNASPPMS
jgi:hypothetical protein